MRWFWPFLPYLVLSLGVSGVTVGSLSLFFAGKPVFEIDQHHDLGVQHFGSIVPYKFPVKNEGNRTLWIEKFATSCSCAGIQMEQDGALVKVDRLSLAPGQEKELILNIAASVTVGSEQKILVVFSTNDPDRARTMATFFIPRIVGPMDTEPLALAVNDLVQGVASQRLIKIRRQTHAQNRVVKVHSSDPADFTVSYRLADAKDRSSPTSADLEGWVEVVFPAKRSGKIEGFIEIDFLENGRYPHRIPVLGQVQPAVALEPDTLIFQPGAHSRPQTIMVHSQLGPIRSVTPVTSGAASTIRILPGKVTGNTVALEVSCQPDAASAPSGSLHTLELQVVLASGQSFRLPVTVVIPREGQP